MGNCATGALAYFQPHEAVDTPPMEDEDVFACLPADVFHRLFGLLSPALRVRSRCVNRHFRTLFSQPEAFAVLDFGETARRGDLHLTADNFDDAPAYAEELSSLVALAAPALRVLDVSSSLVLATGASVADLLSSSKLPSLVRVVLFEFHDDDNAEVASFSPWLDEDGDGERLLTGAQLQGAPISWSLHPSSSLTHASRSCLRQRPKSGVAHRRRARCAGGRNRGARRHPQRASRLRLRRRSRGAVRDCCRSRLGAAACPHR